MLATSRNFFWGLSKKELVFNLTKAQEASEIRLSKAQADLKADLKKDQEASETRLNSSQKSLKADFQSLMNSILYKAVILVTGTVFSCIAFFETVGIYLHHPWRQHEVQSSNK